MTAPSIRRGLLIAAGALLASRHVYAQADRNGDVTVMLFQTEAVQRLHVDARGATLRSCERCAPINAGAALNIAAEGDAVLASGLPRSPELRIAGQASLTSAGGHTAAAAGQWIVRAKDGQLRVSVVIPLERYVAAVLAGETTTAEPPESLRAMAVVVRSFAVAVAARHPGGALCDTTHCQALRLAPVPEQIRSAVWATTGETLWFRASRVPAYFSQHCGGFTEDAVAAWHGRPQPWLVAHMDTWCARAPSTWRASLPVSDVQRALVAERLATDADLRDIAVLTRDRSGRVQQVRLRFANGSSRQIAAATLRFALDRSLGWNQLRSDRYQLRRAGERFVFEGTGHGHGVGLCQVGAAAMARAGRNYRDILSEYFPGTVVRVSAADTGWQSVQGRGSTLRATKGTGGLLADASRAYAAAALQWGAPLPADVSVSVFDSTAAYRQATGQPGWQLASTQGGRIASQAAALLAAHGGTESVLRHEFLHTAVEAVSAPSAPLWLREGLVEVLNHERCGAGTAATPQSVDNALLHATTEQQARRAHLEACALASQQVERYGLSAVRQKLQQGTTR